MNPTQANTQTLERGEGSERPTFIKAQDVTKYFGESSFLDRVFDGEPPVKVVDGMDLHVREVETLGVVGESGCGRSTLGLALLNLPPSTDGKISFRETMLDGMEDGDWKEFRSECQVVFQNPHSSLNPKHIVGGAIKRPLELLTDQSEDEQCERVTELPTRVGLQPSCVNRHPWNLSGGEKQCVAIACAFSANPSFVVLDGPVSVPDVSVQASILNLLVELQEEYGTSHFLVGHDFSVINYISDRMAAMYLGNFAEVGPTESVFGPLSHPYIRVLLSNIPSADPSVERERIYLKGDVSNARDLPSGCPS